MGHKVKDIIVNTRKIVWMIFTLVWKKTQLITT